MASLQVGWCSIWNEHWVLVFGPECWLNLNWRTEASSDYHCWIKSYPNRGTPCGGPTLFLSPWRSWKKVCVAGKLVNWLPVQLHTYITILPGKRSSTTRQSDVWVTVVWEVGWLALSRYFAHAMRKLNVINFCATEGLMHVYKFEIITNAFKRRSNSWTSKRVNANHVVFS